MRTESLMRADLSARRRHPATVEHITAENVRATATVRERDYSAGDIATFIGQRIVGKGETITVVDTYCLARDLAMAFGLEWHADQPAHPANTRLIADVTTYLTAKRRQLVANVRADKRGTIARDTSADRRAPSTTAIADATTTAVKHHSKGHAAQQTCGECHCVIPTGRRECDICGADVPVTDYTHVGATRADSDIVDYDLIAA